MKRVTQKFVIESEKGWIAEKGVQKGEWTTDLSSAKLYNTHRDAHNMMIGWSKKSEWNVECWVTLVDMEANVRTTRMDNQDDETEMES